MFPAEGSDCDVLPAIKQNAGIGDVPPTASSDSDFDSGLPTDSRLMLWVRARLKIIVLIPI